jgi:non-ribosomal peptide synthetase component E (peptide arylation enzyme)
LPELVQHCVDAGMMRQKIPEQLQLVDSIPRNASGKLDKRLLKERLVSA